MILARNFSEDWQGIFYMVICCFCIAVMISIVRHLSSDYHVVFILMVRNFFAIAFFIPELIKDHRKLLYTKRPKLHLFRGVNGMFAMMTWFFAISKLPLSEAVSISFIIPIITTLVAMFLLKERVQKDIWLALFIGFIGVAIILRPGFKELASDYLYVFAAVILWTISNVSTKILAKTEKPKTIVIYMALVMLVFSIPLAIPYFKAIDFTSLLWFIALGFISNIAHFSISFAYTKTNLSILQPFDFSRLIFTSIIAYYFFDEVMDFWVMTGSIIILIGVITTIPKKKRQKIKKIIQNDNL